MLEVKHRCGCGPAGPCPVARRYFDARLDDKLERHLASTVRTNRTPGRKRVHLPVGEAVPVAAWGAAKDAADVVSPTERLRCRPYRTELFVKDCAKRQAYVAAGVNVAGFWQCKDCGDGRLAVANAGIDLAAVEVKNSRMVAARQRGSQAKRQPRVAAAALDIEDAAAGEEADDGVVE